MNFERLPLIVTDGFEFYRKVIRRFFGPACLYGQVLKTRRNDRIIKVERRALHGAAWRFDDALNNSEDSSTLKGDARVLSSFVFLDRSASSEGWHVQWERVPPGKKLAPRSLSHVRGGNETDEAD